MRRLFPLKTNEAPPQTDKHVESCLAPLACMRWKVFNPLHAWDHRKAIARP